MTGKKDASFKKGTLTWTAVNGAASYNVYRKKAKGKYKKIVNRTEAIKYAINMASKNDIIVLAGKGHETYQEINGIKHHYDEREIIKEVI